MIIINECNRKSNHIKNGNANPSLRTLARLVTGMGLQLEIRFTSPT